MDLMWIYVPVCQRAPSIQCRSILCGGPLRPLAADGDELGGTPVGSPWSQRGTGGPLERDFPESPSCRRGRHLAEAGHA